jgi:hypothetical protein
MKQIMLITMVAVGVAMLPFTASATRIASGMPTPLDATLTFGDAHELSLVLPGDPNGMQDRLSYVNFSILLALGATGDDIRSGKNNFITRTLNNFGALPTAVLAGFHNGNHQGTIDENKLGTTFEYLWAKYSGGDQASETFIWFIGNLNGIINIPTIGPNGRHLGSWSLFNPAKVVSTPDGGATVALLGIALVSLEVLRRKFLAA